MHGARCRPVSVAPTAPCLPTGAGTGLSLGLGSELWPWRAWHRPTESVSCSRMAGNLRQRPHSVAPPHCSCGLTWPDPDPETWPRLACSGRQLQLTVSELTIGRSRICAIWAGSARLIYKMTVSNSNAPCAPHTFGPRRRRSLSLSWSRLIPPPCHHVVSCRTRASLGTNRSVCLLWMAGEPGASAAA